MNLPSKYRKELYNFLRLQMGYSLRRIFAYTYLLLVTYHANHRDRTIHVPTPRESINQNSRSPLHKLANKKSITLAQSRSPSSLSVHPLSNQWNNYDLSIPTYHGTNQWPKFSQCTYNDPDERHRSKEESRVLINGPIEKGSNDEKSVSLPGSRGESSLGFRLVARRIITRNQSFQIVSQVYKVYFDVSQRGNRIGMPVKPGRTVANALGPYREDAFVANGG